jgi:AsmA protein
MKKLLVGVAIVAVIAIAGLVAFVLLINPNQFKPLIVEQTKNATGLDLVIDGDIHWQFFPTLGFAIGKTEMRNPDGFEKENLFQVNAIDVSIELMPLFDKQLTVGKVTLNGADIQLETLNNGRTNLDSFTATDATSNSKSDPSGVTTSISVSSDDKNTSQVEEAWRINVAGLSIINSNLEVNDRKTGASTKLQVVDLSVSEFTPGEWSQVSFDLTGVSNGQQFAADGASEFMLSANLKDYALRQMTINSSFDDGSNKISSATLALNHFEFGHPAQLDIKLNGLIADLAVSLTGKTELLLDAGLTSVKASNLSLSAEMKGSSLPQSPLNISLVSDLSFDINKSELNATISKLTANDITMDGATTVTLADITKIRFNVHSNSIDVDQFLGLNTAQPIAETASSGNANDAAKPASETVSKEVEPDLSALKSLDVAGTIAIDKLKANNVDMSNVKSKFAINRGLVTLESFNANLYQGSVVASGQLDGRKSPATYSVKKTVKGVQIEPLLQAVAQTDIIEGTGNIVANISGKSLAPTAMKENLVGSVEMNIADGAVNGMNIAQQIRVARARLKGNSTTEVAERKTDFSALTATLTLNKGLLTTDNLAMQSPLLRIRGKGNTNYINETINLWLDASVVGALEGQGGADVDELKDLTIPVEVKGTWSQPNVDIALDVVLKQRAKQQIDKEVSKLQDKIDRKIKDEDTKEAVNKLLKKLF